MTNVTFYGNLEDLTLLKAALSRLGIEVENDYVSSKNFNYYSLTCDIEDSQMWILKFILKDLENRVSIF